MISDLVLKTLIRAKHLLRNEEGASGIEYAIVATMVAVVLVAFSADIAEAIEGTFQTICDSLKGSACT